MGDHRTCSHCGMTFSPRFFSAIGPGTKRLDGCQHRHRTTDVHAKPWFEGKREHRELAFGEEEARGRWTDESGSEELR